PVKQPGPGGATLVYQGFVLGWADVVGEDKKMGRKYPRALRLLAAAPADGQPVDWSRAETIGDALDDQAQPGARWTAAPASLNDAQKVKALEKAFGDYLNAIKLTVPSSEKLKMRCDQGEDLETFRGRCQVVAWREFEKELVAKREFYASEFAKYQVSVPQDPPVGPSAGWEERWQSCLRSSPVRRTAPPAALPAKQKQELENLEMDWHKEKVDLAQSWRRACEQFKELPISLRRADTRLVRFGLAWAPFWLPAGAG